jgi:hypothetical protein
MGQEGAWSAAHSHGGVRAVECARVDELWGNAALGQCCDGDGGARVGLLSLNSSDPPSSGDEEMSLLLRSANHHGPALLLLLILYFFYFLGRC